MKKQILLILIFSQSILSFSQSKKERIELLNYKIDSLLSVLKHRRYDLEENISHLNNTTRKETSRTNEEKIIQKTEITNIESEKNNLSLKQQQIDAELKKNIQLKLEKEKKLILLKDSLIYLSNSYVSKKRKITTSLIGEHKIERVSRLIGANGMEDFYFENNKWKASGSSIYQAMRRPYKVDITNEDLSVLNTLKIIVNKDLSINLISKNQIILTIPYNDELNLFEVSKLGGDHLYEISLDDKINQNTIFFEGSLIYSALQYDEDKLKYGLVPHYNLLFKYNFKEKKMVITSNSFDESGWHNYYFK
jgi:hypothetical protein